MALNWTEEQQKVIDLRDRNILVSAAAGSGKTAVLVERIIQRITAEEHPVDIDRILVVTFTKAAAAEMRERISAAINRKKEEAPEDENLQRQLTLIHNAQITTIDSFCLYVVRNHFGEISLDPNFRIADTGEIKLLEMDILKDVFEKNYKRPDNEAFLNLIDSYSGKRNDQAVRDMVSRIYHMSSSDSWPKQWIARLLDMYEAESVEELERSQIMRDISSYVKVMLVEAKERLERLKEMAEQTEGLEKYAETLSKDLALFEQVETLETFEELRTFFQKISLGNIAAIRKFEGDEQRKEAVKNGRAAVKEEIKQLKEAYFSQDMGKLSAQIKRLRPIVEELVRLTLEYVEAMEEAKREKRVVDFSDIEHFALRILVDEETKERKPAAKEFRQQLVEIMIDEYQDSNQVQEDIMRAISREPDGHNNMFMVGDVKQSIYRFRLARPELFMQKYGSYATADVVEGRPNRNQRIDLHRNFRSRKEVIDFCNDIFYKIMHPDLGGVAYDDAAALYHGAVYPQAEGMETELLLLDKKDEELLELSAEGEDNRRIEARLVAARIKRLVEEAKVTDKETGELRRVRYSDIVILFRSLQGWGADFVQILESSGIPAHVESSTGYFSAYEVQIVMCMLRILDNPYQDIPMAAVLKSPIAGLDDEELAQLRVTDTSVPFAAAALSAMEEAEEGRLKQFYEKFRRLREMVRDTPIHELITIILDETGFMNYVAAMPAGARRAQNLSMLLEKAIAYEKTSYKGLFHFVRYIDELQRYEVDFGEAELTGENEDVVHIMTIHKSKGLEFPIVFVSGLGKKINQRDSAETMVLHPELGIGLYEMTKEPRTRRTSLFRSEIVSRIRRENLGEELRVLYVALTRAKEKLILTGMVSDEKKTVEKYIANVIPKVPISFSQRSRAATYLDWLIPAVLSYPDKYELQFVSVKELAAWNVKELAEEELDRVELEYRIANADIGLAEELTASFSFCYPYQNEAGRKSKYSVSELKHASMVEQLDKESGEAEELEFLKTEREEFIPEFARRLLLREGAKELEESRNWGALRGTAVHRVMECLDFSAIAELDLSNPKAVWAFVMGQLEGMEKRGEITEEMRKLVHPSILAGFVQSDAALCMARADARGELFKEKPFVMEYNEVLVQGIIDVFWFDGDELYLLDYKTDRVEREEELVLRYQTQLELYAEALTKIFTTEERTVAVKERLIYSFCLEEVIHL